MRPLFRVAYWLLIAAFIALGGTALVRPSFSPPVWLLPAGIYLLLLVTVIRPWRIRRRFAKRPDKDAQIEWLIDEDKIRASSVHGQSEFNWSAFTKVVETPAGFLFYSTPEVFHWLPRHGFLVASDFERVSEIARRSVSEFHCAA